MNNNLIIIFIIAQLINVIISTLKYILTSKAKPIMAAAINAVSYTVGAAVTYLISKEDNLTIVMIITFLANIAGVPIGRWIVDNFSKDRLWVYNATMKINKNDMDRIYTTFKSIDNISCVYEELDYDKLYEVKFFANNKEDSKRVVALLKRFHAKYYIIEPR